MEHPRIDELGRRLQRDPASIAFAQLAEEHRRAGHYAEAVSVCRAGLAIHPTYLSARVTLGRALIEMNDLATAETELELVLQHAPENLAAIRGLAEIHHRRGELDKALTYYRSALGLARHDPDLEQTVEEIARSIAPPDAPAAEEGLSFEEVSAAFMAHAGLGADEGGVDDGGQPAAEDQPAAPAHPMVETPAADAAGLPELERFLGAIHTYRHRKAV